MTEGRRGEHGCRLVSLVSAGGTATQNGVTIPAQGDLLALLMEPIEWKCACLPYSAFRQENRWNHFDSGAALRRVASPGEGAWWRWPASRALRCRRSG